MLKVKLLTALISFLVTLIFAVQHSWSVGDIVWSVWLGSLVTSVVLIFTAFLVAPMYKESTRQIILKRIVFAFGPGSARHQIAIALGLLFFVSIILIFLIMWFHRLQAAMISPFFAMIETGIGEHASVPYREIIATYWVYAALAVLYNLATYIMIILGKRDADVTLPFVFLMHNTMIIIGMMLVSAISPDTGAKYFVLIAYFLPFDVIRDAVKAVRAKNANP